MKQVQDRNPDNASLALKASLVLSLVSLALTVACRYSRSEEPPDPNPVGSYRYLKGATGVVVIAVDKQSLALVYLNSAGGKVDDTMRLQELNLVKFMDDGPMVQVVTHDTVGKVEMVKIRFVDRIQGFVGPVSITEPVWTFPMYLSSNSADTRKGTLPS